MQKLELNPTTDTYKFYNNKVKANELIDRLNSLNDRYSLKDMELHLYFYPVSNIRNIETLIEKLEELIRHEKALKKAKTEQYYKDLLEKNLEYKYKNITFKLEAAKENIKRLNVNIIYLIRKNIELEKALKEATGKDWVQDALNSIEDDG